MPELPEVETIRQGLEGALVGRTFLDARIGWEGAVQGLTAQELRAALAQQRILGIGRRGKYLLFRLSGDHHLIVHLKMTGQLLIRSKSDPPDTYVRNVFVLDGDLELRFSDIRKFGRIWLVREPNEVVGGLGMEPLNEEFTAETLAARLSRRSAPIKPLLLDQTAVAGLGNIYADEALFEAGIDPHRSGSSLSFDEVRSLRQAIHLVLERSLDHRGTSFGQYVDATGEPGSNRHHLKAYGRKGEPCLRCGGTIVRAVLRQRGTFYCPGCQR